MHILQIYKDYAPVLGGIENHVRDLSELLVAHGHHVTVLVTSLDHRTQVEQPQPHLRIIKARRWFHAASTPISLAMFGQARALKPDVVHLHFPYPPGDLAARAVPNRPPLVLTYHSDIVRQQAMLRLYRPLLHATLARASRIIATSPAYLASSPFLRRYTAKAEVIPLGINLSRFANAAASAQVNERPTVLFVGRLRYYKGLHLLLEAMQQVDGQLLIAGSGPERERLAAQAAQLGIANRVAFLGDIGDADLPALYRRADVFVLPAHLRAEALGLAQIEALASGLPCVSTELGTGTSFANQHGETGLVVPPGDPDALARAINQLLADPALRQRFGAAARSRAHALFDQQHMVTEVERIYSDVLRRRG